MTLPHACAQRTRRWLCRFSKILYVQFNGFFDLLKDPFILSPGSDTAWQGRKMCPIACFAFLDDNDRSHGYVLLRRAH